MAQFFIDTATGQVATHKQLVAAKISEPGDVPPRPWLRIQGTSDAITMWYAVMRKQTKGVYIGALCLRHTDHHALLLQQGWQEVDVSELRAFAA
ncbi:MAG TPA: hypothetical protein VF533_15940 [Solirubrobacteraceae bacterium]|jgi:hypothetical protein